VPYVGVKVAELHQAAPSRVAQVTCENAARLFGASLDAEAQRPGWSDA
jgi:hypothetical protein